MAEGKVKGLVVGLLVGLFMGEISWLAEGKHEERLAVKFFGGFLVGYTKGLITCCC
jgi:putative N-acetylmannosamine-6-phosphate epimerase